MFTQSACYAVQKMGGVIRSYADLADNVLSEITQWLCAGRTNSVSISPDHCLLLCDGAPCKSFAAKHTLRDCGGVHATANDVTILPQMSFGSSTRGSYQNFCNNNA